MITNEEARKAIEKYQKEHPLHFGTMIDVTAISSKESTDIISQTIEQVSKKIDEDTELWCICEMARMYMQGVRPVYPVRPQGEWKLHGMIYYCSVCGHDCEQGGNNFCGNCGADMRGEPCSHDCDTCEHGVPIDGQFYDDGTPIHECGIRPTEQSEQEAKQYALGYQDGFLDARKKAIADGLARPQGEWYYNYQNGWHCSICHEPVEDMPTVMGKANFAFCPNCGAKMKGGAE